MPVSPSGLLFSVWPQAPRGTLSPAGPCCQLAVGRCPSDGVGQRATRSRNWWTGQEGERGQVPRTVRSYLPFPPPDWERPGTWVRCAAGWALRVGARGGRTSPLQPPAHTYNLLWGERGRVAVLALEAFHSQEEQGPFFYR